MQNIVAWCSMLTSSECDMQHDYFQKRKQRPFDPIQGVNDVTCKGNINASMLLYASFPLD